MEKRAFPTDVYSPQRKPDGGTDNKLRDTEIGMLRQTYGEAFAPGYHFETKLGVVLKKEGKETLDQLLKKKR